MKIALLMLTYASLHSIDELPPFYTHLFHGLNPSPEYMEHAAARFRAIGTADPLGAVTARQAAALEQRLNTDPNAEIKIYLASKHTPPFIDDAVRQMIADGVDQIYSFPTSPLYSRTGTAAYHFSVRKALAAAGADIPVIEINHWHKHPGVTEAISLRLRTALAWVSAANRPYTKVLFTAHSQPGLPKANMEFIQTFSELAESVADKANCSRWSLAYRSAGPPPQKWLSPDVLDIIEKVAHEGYKAVIVCDLLSLTENVEAIYDCKIDCQDKAAACGLEFVATEFLNDSADYIDALASLIRDRIQLNGAQ
ncbi:ferrochelatase [Paenibacillus azoreducens]|uniref:ferrochelatase n=1 Tax=Paenibacillus azoreducens TaxID=116718 RepID=UPI0039F628C3